MNTVGHRLPDVTVLPDAAGSTPSNPPPSQPVLIDLDDPLVVEKLKPMVRQAAEELGIEAITVTEKGRKVRKKDKYDRAKKETNGKISVKAQNNWKVSASLTPKKVPDRLSNRHFVARFW